MCLECESSRLTLEELQIFTGRNTANIIADMVTNLRNGQPDNIIFVNMLVTAVVGIVPDLKTVEVTTAQAELLRLLINVVFNIGVEVGKAGVEPTVTSVEIDKGMFL